MVHGLINGVTAVTTSRFLIVFSLIFYYNERV